MEVWFLLTFPQLSELVSQGFSGEAPRNGLRRLSMPLRLHRVGDGFRNRLWQWSKILLLSLASCATLPTYQVEKHEVQNLTVVFLDERALQDEWKRLSGNNAVTFLPLTSSGIPGIKTVRGFYDFKTNTLYCPKWNYEVCGHELHHAVLGHFHSSE